MSFAVVGTAVAGGVASAAISGMMNNGSSSNSPTSSGTPAAAADPFASQRAGYQPQLQGLMNTAGTQGGATQNVNAITQMANSTAQGNIYQSQMAAMLNPGTSQAALAQMPGYQFAMNQGVQTTDRSAAASGMLGSGNEAAELTQFGQGLADQQFQTQFNNLNSMSTSMMNNEQQAAGQLNTLDVNAANNFSNNYQQLAQLSGANTGQPGVAGQLQQQANAATAGYVQGIVNPAVQGIANYMGNGSNSTYTALTGGDSSVGAAGLSSSDQSSIQGLNADAGYSGGGV